MGVCAASLRSLLTDGTSSDGSEVEEDGFTEESTSSERASAKEGHGMGIRDITVGRFNPQSTGRLLFAGHGRKNDNGVTE